MLHAAGTLKLVNCVCAEVWHSNQTKLEGSNVVFEIVAPPACRELGIRE